MAASRYVALLRGVNNVGATRRVAMADLRAGCEGLGFRDVHTVLNSGNVVFTAPGRGRREVLRLVEDELPGRLGLPLAIVLLSGREVVAAVRDNPLAHLLGNPSRFLVVVPRAPSDLARLDPLLEKRWAPEALAVGPRVAYLWCANGVARSPVWAAVERALERTGTARNIATMKKLADLA